MEVLVLILSHIVIGLLFGLKEIGNIEQWKKESKAYRDERRGNPNAEKAYQMAQNIPLVLTIYAIVGYFNFYFVFKRLLKKKK